MRRLRGTAFDMFGYTAERKLERALIPWFEDAVERLLARLGVENLRWSTETIGLVMEIRGYGPVKEEAIRRIKAKVEERMRTGFAPADQRELEFIER
jgi:indolepyruvate ferredoxin oxidoreductase